MTHRVPSLRPTEGPHWPLLSSTIIIIQFNHWQQNVATMACGISTSSKQCFLEMFRYITSLILKRTRYSVAAKCYHFIQSDLSFGNSQGIETSECICDLLSERKSTHCCWLTHLTENWATTTCAALSLTLRRFQSCWTAMKVNRKDIHLYGLSYMSWNLRNKAMPLASHSGMKAQMPGDLCRECFAFRRRIALWPEKCRGEMQWGLKEG